jgi:uncharacterized protein (DUF1800 family)
LRQLLEQFTLGPGVASEEDIVDAARAFTGWFVTRGRLRFVEREHDGGTKTVMGQTGPWKADDILRIVGTHPACARHVVRKMYRWLISEEEPSDAMLEPLIRGFATHQSIGRLVATMLRSTWFFSTGVYRRCVKSPVELAVGLVRGLEASVPTMPLGHDLAELGQALYDPPTPGGWAGGHAWLNLSTLIGRANLIFALLGDGGRYAGRMDPLAAAEKQGQGRGEAARRFLADLLVQDDLPEQARELIADSSQQCSPDRNMELRHIVNLIGALPEYQLA